MSRLEPLQLSEHLFLLWAGSCAWLLLLGLVRTVTDAEFALASAAIMPVCLLAWAGGLRHGASVAVLATVMWLVSGLLSLPPGRPLWVPLINDLTRLLTYLLVAYLTARVRTLLLLEAHCARTDGLTGLLNRRAFELEGLHESRRALRYRHPLALMFIDLDRFKKLNDTRGHAAGDAALRAVARALQSGLRQTDRAARIGGDEFAVLLPEIDRAGAAAAARKVSGQIESALRDYAPVSASIGVAWFQEAVDFDFMLHEADALMYRIKEQGRGGWQLMESGWLGDATAVMGSMNEGCSVAAPGVVPSRVILGRG